MGYVFLLIALSFGLIKAYCGKRTSYAAEHIEDAVAITTVRMLLCCIIGFICVLLAIEGSIEFFHFKTVWIAAICGTMSAVFTVSWMLAVRDSMYMMVEVFVMGGVLVPLFLSSILYGEGIGVIDIVAIVILLLGVYLTSSGSVKGKWSLKGVALLILCALSSGGMDFSQKMYVKEAGTSNVFLFNFYTYVFAALILSVVFLCLKIGKRNKDGQSASFSAVKSVFGYVVVMSVCLFFNSYFKTLAANNLDAVILYPMSQGLAIVLSSVMTVVLFKEKISVKSGIGIALTLISLIMINF
jgi:drug/metabolite transporter (DMT)-like permease